MIRGERVYLRLTEVSDLNILYRLYYDNDFTKYNYNEVCLIEKLDALKHFNVFKKLHRKILSILNESDLIIGFMNYYQNEENDSVYKIGITIGRKFWRRGYGRDSIITIARYLFDEKNANRIELEAEKDNLRAIKCYNSCGFVEEGKDNLVHMCLRKIEFEKIIKV